MPAFRIFDPYAFLNAEEQGPPTEKAAKAWNPEPDPTRGLAGLATLAGVPIVDRTAPGSDGEYSGGGPDSADDSLENGDQTVAAAKVAKVAKDEGGAPAASKSECDFEAVHQDCDNARSPEPQLISPASWFEHCAPAAPREPPYDQPCPARRGRVERKGVALLHFCVTCGAWGAFGYGVFADRPGRWYCLNHRPSG
jgi:hypothetical protein